MSLRCSTSPTGGEPDQKTEEDERATGMDDLSQHEIANLLREELSDGDGSETQ